MRTPTPPDATPGRLRRWWFHRRNGSRTRILLERHLALALVLAVVGAGALVFSYREADRAASELRDPSARAVLGVAGTRLALLVSLDKASETVDAGLTGTVGQSEGHRVLLAAARKSLSELSLKQIDGAQGRATCDTVEGLVASYAQSVTDGTVRQADGSLMQRQRMAEARSLLERAGTGVKAHLDGLQRGQLEKIGDDTTLGPLQYAGWAVAELALIALLLTILSALRLLRRRCGRRYDVSLIAALLLTAALAVVPLGAAAVTQNRLADSRRALDAFVSRTHGDRETPAAAQEYVIEESPKLLTGLNDDGRPPWVYYTFLAGGFLICVLPAAGCVRRLNADYWRAAS
ncbi:hypothetical protein ACIO3O_17220 [Streptomyces sp. NPDC087440]|uniref:hypothetical protein n=1 Tax=Streptomyces sp. NPDC087440 TaxID=3365790 RepID=UPI00382CDBCE